MEQRCFLVLRYFWETQMDTAQVPYSKYVLYYEEIYTYNSFIIHYTFNSLIWFNIVNAVQSILQKRKRYGEMTAAVKLTWSYGQQEYDRIRVSYTSKHTYCHFTGLGYVWLEETLPSAIKSPFWVMLGKTFPTMPRLHLCWHHPVLLMAMCTMCIAITSLLTTITCSLNPLSLPSRAHLTMILIVDGRLPIVIIQHIILVSWLSSWALAALHTKWYEGPGSQLRAA